jgi:hypothetical protein
MGFILKDRPLPYDDGIPLVMILAVKSTRPSIRLYQFNIVSHLPLQAHIRHDALVGVGLDARHVAGVRITIGVAIGHIEKDQNVMSVRNDIVHVIFLLPGFISGLLLQGNFCSRSFIAPS